MEDKKQNEDGDKDKPRRNLSFEAATHDVNIAPPKSPEKAEHTTESTGRRSDGAWKEKKKTEGH